MSRPRSPVPAAMSAQDEFNKIFAVRIVGAAGGGSKAAPSDTALSFEVQGTRSRWRVVRTRSDFSALADKFSGSSKMPRLPGRARVRLAWASGCPLYFGCSKGAGVQAPAATALQPPLPSSRPPPPRAPTFSADTQLQHLLNFLNPVRADAEISSGRSATPPLHPSDNDDTDSMLSSRTSVSARTSAANSAAGSDQNDIFESTETDMNCPHPNSSSSSSAAPASASASTREKDRSSARIPTARARRRDSVDGMIANFVPDIVSAKMTQLKKEKEQLQRRLKNERKRWQSDSRQIRSVLQQRYEGLMTAAERDRERLERQITELELKNKSLKQGIEQLQLQQRREAETPQPSHSDISSAAKEAAAAATITATQTINVLTEKNGKLGEQLSALENRLRVESLAREEAQSAVVRMEREVKRLGESRDRGSDA